ncbi:MAG: PhoPQ-activated protein PqaA family protein [Bacteroidota bacterium]
MQKRITLLFITVLILFIACSPTSKKDTPVTPETALQRYLDNGDETYSWEVKEKYKLDGLDAIDILLTTQKWREHVWTHQLTLFIPDKTKFDGALLFITGGSIKNGMPNWKSMDDDLTQSFAAMAKKNSALVAVLRQTPNQPLYDELVEDQLISYTLHNYKADKDHSWPLLFPMVKGAKRAMDAIQEYTKENETEMITRFTVSGASKRGWTTWLTGASDKRVEAIAPMVIDVLNMPVSLDYHLEAWNEYSIQIEDYIKLEIPQTVHSEDGNAITIMVDPYSYRDKLTMPKIIFIGTNDEYWPVDAIKHYIDDIPGINNIHYVPNAGHDLGDGVQALQALSAFWGRTLDKKDYPNYSWEINPGNSSTTLNVHYSGEKPVNAYLWSAESDDRDFRDEKWHSEKINIQEQKIIENILYPENGYKAFYIDLEYTDPKGGTYVKSTRMFVCNNIKIL